MDVFETQCVVVGAGVVGLAIARKLALQGQEVLLVERQDGIGQGISSRNSEVIHAGIYYPKGSLKARFCVEGKELLYRYCQENYVPFSRTGKLIVATNQEEMLKLDAISKHAQENGVMDIQRLTQNDVACLEPDLLCSSALFSPSTGIVDSHALMLQLLADFESAGGVCVFNTGLRVTEVNDNGLHLTSLEGEYKIIARTCVNATGLDAFDFCRDVKGFPNECLYPPRFAKGSYFSYQGNVPFRHLIYPVPVDGGLGIHLTLDLQGTAKFGPDVDWLSSEETHSFSVDESKKECFYRSIKRYWPEVEEKRLQADYAGIRPKLSGPGESPADFLIQDDRFHGIKGLVNLLGIESPGLTSTLAIADYVADCLR